MRLRTKNALNYKRKSLECWNTQDSVEIVSKYYFWASNIIATTSRFAKMLMTINVSNMVILHIAAPHPQVILLQKKKVGLGVCARS